MSSAATTMMLFDRYVRFEDEILAVVKESGQPSLDELIESILDSLPDSEERDAAVDAEIARYTDEVALPALAVLRERKRSRPSAAVRKAPIACDNVHDVAYYSELLDGIEPCLSSVDGGGGGGPSVTSLTLRTSWPPEHPVRRHPFCAVVAGSDDAFLVLYFGWHRPGRWSPGPGFYLIYDLLASSVTIVPPLSSFGSHCGLGTGLGAEVAILGIHKEPHQCFYVLAELLRVKRHGTHSHLQASNKQGTLFMWWSPGSGPLATGRWIQRDVVLPIPADGDEGDTSTTPTCSLYADMAIPVSGRCICWVDLLKGILVGDRFDRLAAAGDGDDNNTTTTVDDDAPVFYFIPLPDGCAIKRDLERDFQQQPVEYRSMCSISSELLRFVSLDGYREGYPIDKVVFRTWNLSLPRDMLTWRWEMVLETRVDIWNDPIYKNDLKLQPLMPRFPTISTTEPDIVYLLLTDFKLQRGRTVTTGCYVFGLDIRRGNIVSAIRLPCSKNGLVFPPKIFASRFSSFLSEEMMLRRRSLGLTDGSIMGQEIVAHEGESSRGKFGNRSLCEDLMTYTLGAHRGKLAKSIQSEEDEPSSMPYTLGAHFAMLKFCQDGLGGRRIISTLGASLSSSKFEQCASLGLRCALS